MNKTVAFIQARMSSSRFPGKVLADVAAQPMISFMVGRARRAETLDEVVVITSDHSSDDPLATVLAQLGIPLFRGDLEDVLKRYADAAYAYGARTVVRLTGDCPLIDPSVIDSVVCALARTEADYCSNIDPPTYADGLDVECFTREALDRAHHRARRPAEREHVTLWMRGTESNLRRTNVVALVDTSQLRLTVDYPDDLHVVRRIVEALGSQQNVFDYYDILRCLDANRDLLEVNRHARNEGLAKSLADSAA